MSRKSQKLKMPRVIADIQDKLLDEPDIQPILQAVPEGAQPIGRLCTSTQGPFPFDPVVIAEAIDFKPRGAFFCDSTLFLSPTATEIWAALLKDRRIVLVDPIITELQPWLSNSRGINPDAHAYISSRLGGNSSKFVRLSGPPDDEELRIAGVYYHSLLSTRKHSLQIARQRLEEKLGRNATAQEVSNFCQQYLTPRGQLLGRQGIDCKVEAHRYHDEWLVVAAIFHAITTGEEVTILTGDEAVFDQFFKCVCLIHNHYFSMIFADRYMADPTAFVSSVEKYPEKGVFIEDDVVVVQKPQPLSYELLPARHREVQIHCMLLQGSWTRISYCAETEMQRLLEIKGRTRGLSTENFNGRNLHWFLTVKGIKTLGDAFAIGDDLVVPNRSVRLCPVDLELSLDSYLRPRLVVYA